MTSNGTAIGAGLYIANSTLNENNNLALINNTITCLNGSIAGNGVGAGIAFVNGSYFNVSNGTTSFSNNTASAGGNDIAFQVSYTGDNSNLPSTVGASGISYYTQPGSTGSLRSAINYAQSWMNGSSPASIAIMLAPANYTISGSNLLTQLGNGDSLTILGDPTNNSTITANNSNTRVLMVNNVNGGDAILQNINITGSNIVNSGNGGAIYLNSGNLTLNNVQVYGNSAGYTGQSKSGANGKGGMETASGSNGSSGVSGYGGGVYIDGGILNLLSNCKIINNYTSRGQQ